MNFTIKSFYNWYRNTLRNPQYRLWMILGTVAYLLSPIDLIPDFLPIVGQLDDLALLTLFISEVSQLIVDRVKSRQGNSPDISDQSTSSGTVDVNAMPVE